MELETQNRRLEHILRLLQPPFCQVGKENCICGSISFYTTRECKIWWQRVMRRNENGEDQQTTDYTNTKLLMRDTKTLSLKCNGGRETIFYNPFNDTNPALLKNQISVAMGYR